jgi:hypothetical protein
MERLKELWCEVMHDSVMWPIHAQYKCRACGRRRAVSWTSDPAGTSRTDLRLFKGDGQFAPVTRM